MTNYNYVSSIAILLECPPRVQLGTDYILLFRVEYQQSVFCNDCRWAQIHVVVHAGANEVARWVATNVRGSVESA